MNSSKSIGGYFQLELQQGDFIHSDGVLLNTARNCFEYILRVREPKHVYIPKFICDVMTQPLEKLKISYSFYQIDENLEIAQELEITEDQLLLYVNYFGIKDNYSKKLIEKYKEKLTLDCSQAFYFEPNQSSHVIYSPRKFFGVSDGGILYTDKLLDDKFETDISFSRSTHLLKRIDLGAEAAYDSFNADEENLNNQPIKLMSNLTKNILASIDFHDAKVKRKENFEFLHNKLKNSNLISIKIGELDCPMVYPYKTTSKNLRKLLIENKIFVAKYWPNVIDWSDDNETEYKFAECTLPLPIDQRYGKKDMEKIIRVLGTS